LASVVSSFVNEVLSRIPKTLQDVENFAGCRHQRCDRSFKT
jgi:hypothetical protein